MSNSIEQRHQENLERLKNFRLMDDYFFVKCFEDSKDCVELILRIVLDKQDLEVKEVRTQMHVANLLKRSVTLDVFATDSSGEMFDIEIQRSDKGLPLCVNLWKKH